MSAGRFVTRNDGETVCSLLLEENGRLCFSIFFSARHVSDVLRYKTDLVLAEKKGVFDIIAFMPFFWPRTDRTFTKIFHYVHSEVARNFCGHCKCPCIPAVEGEDTQCDETRSRAQAGNCRDLFNFAACAGFRNGTGLKRFARLCRSTRRLGRGKKVRFKVGNVKDESPLNMFSSHCQCL